MAFIDASNLDPEDLNRMGQYKHNGIRWAEDLADIRVRADSIDSTGELKYGYVDVSEIFTAKHEQVIDLGNGSAEIHYSLPEYEGSNYSRTVKFIVPLLDDARIPIVDNKGHDFKTGEPEPANAGLSGYLLLGLIAVGALIAFGSRRR